MLPLFIFEIGYGVPVTIYDLAQACNKIIKKSGTIQDVSDLLCIYFYCICIISCNQTFVHYQLVCWKMPIMIKWVIILLLLLLEPVNFVLLFVDKYWCTMYYSLL